MVEKKICLLIIFAIFAHCQVHKISKESFTTVFKIPFDEFQSSQAMMHQDWFILFYTPEVDQSLDAREPIYSLQEEYESLIVQDLKKKGLKEFQEFEKELDRYPKIGEVDCGEDPEICSYFGIQEYPSLLYFQKNKKAYAYSGWLSEQQLIYFLSKASRGSIDKQMARSHKLREPGLQILKLLKSDFVLYFVVFLVLPFLYGYLCIAKKQNDTTNAMKKQ